MIIHNEQVRLFPVQDRENVAVLDAGDRGCFKILQLQDRLEQAAGRCIIIYYQNFVIFHK